MDALCRHATGSRYEVTRPWLHDETGRIRHRKIAARVYARPRIRSNVAKKRVYELAKDFGVDSKTVLDKLKDMGEFVKSASSTVEAPVARKLKNAFQKGEAKPGASAAERKTPAPAPSEHRAPAVKPAPVAKPGLGKKPAAAPRPAEPRSAAPAAHVPSSNRGTTPRDNRNESRGDMRDARPNREGGENRPSPAPAAVRRIPEEAPIRVSRARASSRAQAAHLPPTAAPVRRLRGLVPATTRSAASRACTRPPRATSPVRTRWPVRP